MHEFCFASKCQCAAGFAELPDVAGGGDGTCIEDSTGRSYLALLKNRWLEIPAAGYTFAGIHSNFGYYFDDDARVRSQQQQW